MFSVSVVSLPVTTDGPHSPPYCILLTKNDISPLSERRIRKIIETSDGFAIAECDLALRGPGHRSRGIGEGFARVLQSAMGTFVPGILQIQARRVDIQRGTSQEAVAQECRTILATL